jgi:hypothetical protein
VFVHSATVEPGHPCSLHIQTGCAPQLPPDPPCYGAAWRAAVHLGGHLEIRGVSQSISADIWRFAAYLGASRLTSVASAMSSVLTANTAGPLHRRPPGRGAIRVYMSTCPAHPTLGAHANPTGPHIGCMPHLRIILWHASAPVSDRRYKRRPRRAECAGRTSSSGGLELSPLEHLVHSSDFVIRGPGA